MFEERPLKSAAGKPRTLIANHGINDCWYATAYNDESGKRVTCPYYSTWSSMLKRVYSEGHLQRGPSYRGCTVYDGWKTFSVFHSWMEKQNWQGKALDKDLLVPGNRHYGPDTCMFVRREINSITILRSNYRGEYPLGVVKNVNRGYTYFIARCSFYGKQTVIGRYKSPDEAAQAYLNAKRKHILELADSEPDFKVKQALIAYQTTF